MWAEIDMGRDQHGPKSMGRDRRGPRSTWFLKTTPKAQIWLVSVEFSEHYRTKRDNCCDNYIVAGTLQWYVGIPVRCCEHKYVGPMPVICLGQKLFSRGRLAWAIIQVINPVAVLFQFWFAAASFCFGVCIRLGMTFNYLILWVRVNGQG